jgi:hypothetical protein
MSKVTIVYYGFVIPKNKCEDKKNPKNKRERKKENKVERKARERKRIRIER